MRVISVNISSGRIVTWKGRRVETGIFKESVKGPVLVRRLHLEGDRQTDLNAHGGAYKAVYAYSAEHYAWWRRELDGELPPGSFGENLTIDGFPKENRINIGDTFRVGTAVLQAVQPRLPCFKLGIRFDDDGMIRRFLEAKRWGIYLRVLKTGEVGAGDAVSLISSDPTGISIWDLATLILSPKGDPGHLDRALRAKALPPDLRRKFLSIKNGFK